MISEKMKSDGIMVRKRRENLDLQVIKNCWPGNEWNMCFHEIYFVFTGLITSNGIYAVEN